MQMAFPLQAIKHFLTIFLNNIKFVEYDRLSQSMKNLIKKSKYAKHQGFGMGSSGRILLQDHSPGDVKFKNIKIREF